MTKLTISPDRENYTVTPKNTFIAKQMTYGNMRRRDDLYEADFYVNVQWTLTLSEFSSLAGFFIENAASIFQIDLLILSSYLIEYDARIVSDSFQILSQKGDIIVCSATLAVLPDLTNFDCHKETVAIENCLDGSIDPVISQLNLFFNDINNNVALKL